MSSLHNVYPLGHRVYQGGRYLRAFDHAPDIDHYEHSILTFLGSLMPFDKQFVNHPAFPSIATIAGSTKICASTVRTKLKSLQQKGYIKVEAVRFVNERGHFQQATNNYFISTLAFDFFDDVLDSRQYIACIRKRAVGDSISFSTQESSPSPYGGGHFTSEESPLSAVEPNSSPQVPKIDPITPDSSERRDLFTIKREVDNIVQMWEELVKIPVSKGEKAKFFREYVRIQGNEIYCMERLLPIASDPYLASRAKSINFLFSGLDCALKNKAEIVQKASAALAHAQSQSELETLLQEIPAFIQTKSRNFGIVSDTIVRHLLQDPIDQAKQRVGMPCAAKLPTNARELRAEIQTLLKTEISDSRRTELQTILDALAKLGFGYCLELFNRFHSRKQVLEVTR